MALCFANDGASKDFRVEDPSGARKGGPNQRSKWARPAGLGQPAVDGVYSYQTSYGFASGRIPHRSQGILLPLSGEPKGIESVEQCATQGFNLVKQGKLSFEEGGCI
jgi:hypothetical protein